MLKKSGTKKGNAMNYLAFIVESSMFVLKKQSAVKPGDAIGGKKRKSLTSLWSTLPTPPLTPRISIVSYFELPDSSLFLFLFLKIKFYIFSSVFHLVTTNH